jgi:hypothetical protein
MYISTPYDSVSKTWTQHSPSPAVRTLFMAISGSNCWTMTFSKLEQLSSKDFSLSAIYPKSEAKFGNFCNDFFIFPTVR